LDDATPLPPALGQVHVLKISPVSQPPHPNKPEKNLKPIIVDVTPNNISSAPIKLLNAVSPNILLEAAAETHRLNYSKLPLHYLSLSKSRLTGLVVVTAMAGYAMAPATFVLGPFAALAIGTALTSASANTINQIMEVDYDSQMDRTKNRVLVQRHLR
jgi:hypothetical protein